MVRTSNDALVIDTNIPDVSATQLRQHVGMIIENTLEGMQPSYSVAITVTNRLRVEVRDLNVTVRSFFANCQPQDPDNMGSEKGEEISPHEARNRIFNAFKNARLDPKHVR